MERQWRVGIVGLHRGQELVQTMAAHSRVSIAALCDVDQATLAETGGRFGLSDRELFANYDDFVNAPNDIVVIATPIGFHASQAIAALASGKHVSLDS
jgi:predicted dehydrogenase